MKKIITLLLILAIAKSLYSQNNTNYPIIFVHGLTGSDQTFQGTMEYLRDHDKLGAINVFDVVLNADNNHESSYMHDDVKWENFMFNERKIKVGKRNFADDIDDFVSGWVGSNLFAINFKEERIRGALGTFNDYFDRGNQSGIFKQGFALSKMISEVLDYTGAEKVILVGHSMGGLCIREYLQRTSYWGTHINWINPYSEDGHKVARVVTIGTPHLGSNTGLDPTKNNKSMIPDKNSEAMRDLKWEYDGYTNCGGTAKGIYIFGGNEYCIKGSFWNTTFENVDINCNGSEYDDIVGISSGTNANPNMDLPQNIKYTWITSVWADWGGNLHGDGAVNIHRQWLYTGNTPAPVGLTDTLLTDVIHTSEGGDYESIIRGLDEPEKYSLAYKLKFGETNLGYITYLSGNKNLDIDMYSVNCEGLNTVGYTIDGWFTGVYMLAIYDENGNWLASKSVNSFPASISANVPFGAEKVYMKVIGRAGKYTWKYPYKITAWSSTQNNTQTINIAGVPSVKLGKETINLNDNFSDITVYPTLVTDNIFVRFNNKSENNDEVNISIYDISGKRFYSNSLDINTGQNIKDINVSALPDGFYLLNLKAGNTSKTLKFIKK